MTKSTYCYNHHQGESISLPKVTLLHQGERETLPNVTLLPPGERGRLPDVTLLPPWERARETIPNIIPNIILSPPGERESPQCYTVTTRVDGDSLMLHCYHQGREGDYTWCYTVTTRGEREIIPNVTPKVTPSPPEMRGRLHLTLHITLHCQCHCQNDSAVRWDIRGITSIQFCQKKLRWIRSLDRVQNAPNIDNGTVSHTPHFMQTSEFQTSMSVQSDHYYLSWDNAL